MHQSQLVSTYTPERDAQGELIGPQGGSSLCIYYATDNRGARWIIKGNPEFKAHSNYQEGYSCQFDELGTWQSALKEVLANRLYHYFGVPVARLSVGIQPIYDMPARNLQHFRGIYEVPETCACLLSRFLDHFQSYGYLPKIADQAGAEYFQLQIEGQLFSERGLGKILAVAHWVGDIDVIGGSGMNVGYRLRQNHDGQLIVESCKIDPGFALTGFEEDAAKHVAEHIQLATSGGNERLSEPTQWPLQTQGEFYQTLLKLSQLSAAELNYLFKLDLSQFIGAPSNLENIMQPIIDNYLTVLIQRRNGLVQRYALQLADLPAGLQTELVVFNTHPVEQLRLRHQFEQQAPALQQALNYYVPPDVVLSEYATDESRVPAAASLQAFLNDNNRRVLLLLGTAGAGKTLLTQQYEQRLWQDYQMDSPNEHSWIPLRIELKRFTERTVGQCVYNTLMDDYRLGVEQIEELQQRPIVLFLDGYDEIAGRPEINLYHSNGLAAWPKLKLIVTCRSQYYRPEMKRLFQGDLGLAFEYRYLAPFTSVQLNRYLQQYKNFPYQACQEFLATHADVQALIATPIMLRLFVDAFPELQAQQAGKRVFSVDVYEAFFKAWYKKQEVRALQSLGHYESLQEMFAKFSKDLAWQMYINACDTVDYDANVSRQGIWQQFFNDTDERVIKARLGCPLTCSGLRYSFMHKSLADYLVAERLWGCVFTQPLAEQLQTWQQRSLLEERRILDFLAERVYGTRTLLKDSPETMAIWSLVYASRGAPHNALAAANAITVLNYGHISLANRDLSNLYLPGADLSDAFLENSGLSGCHLENVILTQANLNDTCLENTHLEKLNFYTYPSFNESGGAISISIDGRWLATGGYDATCRLWEISTGKCVKELKGHRSRVTSVALSGNGLWVVTGSRDATCRLWEVSTGQCVKVFKGRGCVNSIALSADGCWLVTGSDDAICRIWELNTGECVKELKSHTRGVNSVALSADGRWLATGSNDAICRIWELSTGECVKELKGHSGDVTSAALSVDGLWMVTGSRDKTCRLWKVSTGECIKELKGHTEGVISVALSRDRLWVVTGSGDKTCRLWEVSTGQCVKELKGHTDSVTSVALSIDGLWVATGSSDGTCRRWSTARFFLPKLQTQPGSINALVISVDRLWMVTGSEDKTCRLWEMSTGQCVKEFKGHTEGVTSVALSSDGLWVVTGSLDKTCRLWEISTGECVRVLKGHRSWVTSVALSGDRIWAVTGSEDKTCRLWNVNMDECVKELKGHTKGVSSVALSTDGGWVVTGSWDKMCRLWEVSTGECVRVFKGHTDWVKSVALNVDGRLLATGSYDKTCRLWEVSTGECVRVLKSHSGWVNSVALDVDGLWVVTGSADKTCRLWEVSTGKCVKELKGHTGGVSSVSLSGDGQLLVTGSDDNTVRFWVREDRGGHNWLSRERLGSQGLLAKGCSIRGAKGLSAQNQVLLEQEGAIGNKAERVCKTSGTFFQRGNKRPGRKSTTSRGLGNSVLLPGKK